MNEILLPVLIFAGLGIVTGLILAIASKLLRITRDPRIDEIIDCLPGANCGGCGYAGCASLAEAIVKDEAKPTACPSADDITKIGEIMGVKVEKQRKMVAHVLCSGAFDTAKRRFHSQDITDCYAAEVLGGGDKHCAAGCIGLGSCVEKCVYGALSIVNGVAVADRDKCRSCGVCVDVCPKGIIRMIPYDRHYFVRCASPEKGKTVRMQCDAGCISCRLCEKSCPIGAITLTDGKIAVINYEKCTGCGTCVSKCPRGIIQI